MKKINFKLFHCYLRKLNDLENPEYETALSIKLGDFPSFKLYEYARNQGILTFEEFLHKIKIIKQASLILGSDNLH